MAKLTAKQKRFCDEYLLDLNATQAAARAGYKDPNIGRQLITKNNVAEYICKNQQELQQRTEISQEKVINALAEIAFSDTTDFAVEGLPIVPGARHKTSSKIKSLELIGKHFGLFERNAASATPNNNLFDAIQNSGKGVCADGIPELQQAADNEPAVVEDSGVSEQ